MYSKGKYAKFDKAVSGIEWNNVMSECSTIYKKWFMFTKKYADKSNNTECITDITFSQDDEFKLMLKVNGNKNCGPDGIHSIILKRVPSLAQPLYLLFRSSLDEGTLLSDWKGANICGLHKKISRKSPNNYRPVSLTSQVVKLFEKIVQRSIMNFCIENSILSCEQHGFRSKFSCLKKPN